MVHTDGKPTIAMRESEVLLEDKHHYFKEYADLGDKESHFLIIEVEGDVTAALDLRNNIEKLEYPGLGMSEVLSMQEYADRVLAGFHGIKLPFDSV